MPAIADEHYKLYKADGCVAALSPLAGKLLRGAPHGRTRAARPRQKNRGIARAPPSLADPARDSMPFVVQLGENYEW